MPSLANPRKPAYWVPTLYFAEGLPYVTIAVVIRLMYKNMGLSDAQIAFWTALIMTPWTIKFLGGPILEMFKTKKYFVVATELLSGLFFGLAAFTLPLSGFFQYSLALLAVVAFSGATHDIAADGVYIDVLSSKDQSRFVGWQGASYNIAKVFAQGGLVFVAGLLEKTVGVTHAWMIVLGAFGVTLALIGLYHTRVLPTGHASTHVKDIKQAFGTFWEVVVTFFRKKSIWWGVAFIILYRSAEGQAVGIVPLFLKAGRDVGGLGLSTSDIGIAYGTFGAAAFILGAILGGYFVAKRGLKRSLFTLCCFFNIPFAAYAFLAYTMPTSFSVVVGAIIFEYFGYGFGFVGLTLYMMQQIAPGKYKMAHYAFATAIMSFGYQIPSMASGYISDWLGYKTFFLFVLIATIPSFLVTWFVPFKEIPEEGSASVEAAEEEAMRSK